MKTLGRILVILVAFTIVMGITYAAVNASNSSSADMPMFERGREGGVRPEDGQPEFPNGGRPKFRGGGRHEGSRGGGWMFGLIKNAGVVAIIVALIAVPRSLTRRKPNPAPAEGE